MLPSNKRVWIKLRTGLPLFPVYSPQGEAPAEWVISQLETNSVASACIIYSSVLRPFCKYLASEGWESLDWGRVDEGVLLKYLTHLRANGREYGFARLRQFYRWATEAGYAGFDQAVADKLGALRIKGNEKGVSVLTGDAKKGPLSDPAFRHLLRLVEVDKEPLLLRVCVLLAAEFGSNVSQLCQLLLQDYVVYETETGEPIYQLNIPRSKKGDGQRDRRQRPLSPKLGRLLGTYIDSTDEARAKLGREDPYLLLTSTGRPMDSGYFYQLLGWFFHRAGLSGVMDGHLSAQRLRKTFATRLVEEGASKEDLICWTTATRRTSVSISRCAVVRSRA